MIRNQCENKFSYRKRKKAIFFQWLNCGHNHNNNSFCMNNFFKFLQCLHEWSHYQLKYKKVEAHCINLVKLPQLVGGPEVYELRQSDSQIHVRNDCVVHLFRKWQMWWQCKCTAYISCYEKRDWLIAPTVVLLSSSHIILILHTPPVGCSHPMIEYGKATCMTLPMWIWAQGLLLAWPNRY